MKKIRVRERWEEVVIRFTDVEVVDEDDNIIESHNVYKEDIEIVESGDNGTYTHEEALRTCSHNSKLMEMIKKVEISLQNEFEFEQTCYSINKSSISFFHKRKDIKVIELENGIELAVWQAIEFEGGIIHYYLGIVSDNPNAFVNPELLKKGKKFKVLM